MKKSICSLALAIVCVIAAQAITTSELVWHSMKEYPLHGTLVHGDSVAYTRLPRALKGVVRDELYDLGTNTAGMYIRFASNASAIGAKWKATKKFNMNHMTATGIRGLDLYVRGDDGRWSTVSSARPWFNDHHTTTMIMSEMRPEMREYMLYLPLYDGVDSIYIGVDSLATVAMPSVDSPRRAKPIVMYGTSILQGGCASRPGMVHTSMLGRMLDREVINLGFSGNARLDMEIARLMADADASLFVIDPLPNLKTPELKERMEPFIAIIREKHPETPILLVESPLFPLMRYDQEVDSTITEKNNVLREIHDRLKVSDRNLYYFEGKDVLGDCMEGTVDNYHLTDLGFSRFADSMYPVLKKLFENR